MSLRVTRETSSGRSFVFSNALATASLTVAEISIRRSTLSYAERAGIPPADVELLIPQQHEEFASSDPDWNSFKGFIKTREEIDRLASALPHSRA